MRQTWLDNLIGEAVRKPLRPAVPFVLADAALGAQLVFEINPRRMEYFLGKYHEVDGRRYLAADWFILPGDWGKMPVNEDTVYRCMRELMAAGEDFMQTPSCRQALHKLRTFGPHMYNGRYVKTPADVETYYRKYIGIAASMRSGGFDRNRADAKQDPHVGAAIGPDGGVFHFRKGHHRFALARELGIGPIPVKVCVIHSKWLMTGDCRGRKVLIERLQQLFEEVENAR